MKLRDIANIQAGHPFRGKIPESKSSPYYVVQMKDVSPDGALGQIDWDKLSNAEVTGRKIPVWLSSGHTLFVARGSRNFGVYINSTPKQAVCAQLFFILSVKPQAAHLVLPQFITWLINNRESQRYFDSDAQGVTQSYAQRNITRRVLEDMPVIMPPLAQQQCIIDLFETAKAERDALQALIENRQTELNGITRDIFQQFSETTETNQ